MNKYYFFIGIIVSLFFIRFNTLAQCTFNGNGDGTSWTDGNNWSCGSEPDPSSDDVIIPAGFNVINDAPADFSFANGNNLTINGSLDMNDKKIEINNSSSFLTISSTGTLIDTKELFFNSGGDGLIELGATVDVVHLKTDDNSELTINARCINVTDKLESLSSSEIVGTGCINYTGSDGNFTNTGNGIYGCTIDDVNRCTLDGGSSCTSCDEIARAPDAGTYNMAANEILCIVGSGAFTGSVSLNGNNSEVCISEGITYTGGLNINADPSIVNNYGELQIANLNINNSSVFNNYGDVQVTDLNINGTGTFNNITTTGTVEVTNNFIINNGTTADLKGNITVGGNLTNNGGDLILDGAYVNITGNFTVNSPSNIIAQGNTSGCEGVSFGSSTFNYTAGFSGDVDICNTTDPNATPTITGSTRCVCTGLLPVEFITYNTKANYTQKLVEVMWSTTLEINSASFEIERSINGYDFTTIGSVSAVGNSNDIQNYTFIDIEPVVGIAYYRIKQIDIDGTFTYTSVMVQRYKSNSDAGTITLSIDEGELQLSFPVYVESGRLEVINQLGQLVLREEVTVNAFNVVIPQKFLKNGFYIIRFSNRQQMWVSKVIVSR